MIFLEILDSIKKLIHFLLFRNIVENSYIILRDQIGLNSFYSWKGEG